MLFKFVYTGGALTEGNGAGAQKARQDLAFLVIDVLLLFLVRMSLCMFGLNALLLKTGDTPSCTP